MVQRSVDHQIQWPVSWKNLYDCVNNDDPSIYLKDVGQEDSMTLLRCQFYVTFVASVFKVIKSPTNNSIL